MPMDASVKAAAMLCTASMVVLTGTMGIAYLLGLTNGVTSPPCPQGINGVQMDASEQKACAEQGCTVWTEDELNRLTQMFYAKGRASMSGMPTWINKPQTQKRDRLL